MACDALVNTRRLAVSDPTRGLLDAMLPLKAQTLGAAPTLSAAKPPTHGL